MITFLATHISYYEVLTLILFYNIGIQIPQFVKIKHIMNTIFVQYYIEAYLQLLQVFVFHIILDMSVPLSKISKKIYLR